MSHIPTFYALDHIGTRVLAHRNLHFKGHVWSVLSAKTGLVIGHCHEGLWLKDVTFVVRAGGLKASQTSGQKNVHAFVKGYVAVAPEIDVAGMVEFSYCPFEKGYFYQKDNGQRLDEAPWAHMTPGGGVGGFLRIKRCV